MNIVLYSIHEGAAASDIWSSIFGLKLKNTLSELDIFEQ